MTCPKKGCGAKMCYLCKEPVQVETFTYLLVTCVVVCRRPLGPWRKRLWCPLELRDFSISYSSRCFLTQFLIAQKDSLND